jgi:hypothetical protein
MDKYTFKDLNNKINLLKEIEAGAIQDTFKEAIRQDRLKLEQNRDTALNKAGGVII